MGFEPTATYLASRHSTTELHPQMVAQPGFEPGTTGYEPVEITVSLSRTICRLSACCLVRSVPERRYHPTRDVRPFGWF